MTDAAHDQPEVPHGVTKLARDLTTEQLAAAPTLASLDALLIDDLPDDEDDAFAAALAPTCGWRRQLATSTPRS